MDLSQIDRMSAVILAKNIVNNHAVLDMSGDLTSYVRRLYRYKIFSTGEIAEFAKTTEYKILAMVKGEEQYKFKSGVTARHLDHLIRMIGSLSFAKLHIKSLIEDGATISAIARVTGISESSLRRWMRKGN